MSADYVRRIERDVLQYRPSIMVPRSHSASKTAMQSLTTLYSILFLRAREMRWPRRYLLIFRQALEPPIFYTRIPLMQTFNVITRLRLWARRAVNTVTRRRNVQRALVHGINAGGHYDRQALLRRLQFVN